MTSSFFLFIMRRFWFYFNVEMTTKMIVWLGSTDRKNLFVCFISQEMEITYTIFTQTSFQINFQSQSLTIIAATLRIQTIQNSWRLVPEQDRTLEKDLKTMKNPTHCSIHEAACITKWEGPTTEHVMIMILAFGSIWISLEYHKRWLLGVTGRD
jgi:hypothetical protein